MTTHYLVVLTCTQCGADVEHVTGGSRRHWQQAAVVACTECKWTGVVNVELTDAREMGWRPTGRGAVNEDGTRKVTAVCGTESGYQRHRKAFNEPACDACRAAHSAAVIDSQRRNRPWRQLAEASA